MENLVVTYKLPEDHFSEVFCVIILYLLAISNFEVEKSLWRPYLSPLYKI